MAIADDDIERIRSAASIVDVVGAHVQLKRAGRNWVGLCPFHGEKTPSFNVREETGRYKCFGCDAAGDVFNFVQSIEHTDFVGAVEHLAGRLGIQLNYTSTGQSKERARRKRLVATMGSAVDWYHDRLLNSADARPARDYLRARGLAGETARTFRLGWAPDDWDVLSGALDAPRDDLIATGLAFVNRRQRLQDSFRARVIFPIFDENGEAVALGGRILPGSDDPAKYKNSSETPIYTKSRTLYGLNWAKSEIVRQNRAIVCEGYTDVIGFHSSGLPIAVATCGTAFTEEHVRLLKRYTSRVVLAFDADAAGQGAAERFYEWEQKYDIEVSVARFPGGRDPGDLALDDPEALAASIDSAMPFLAFRLDRVLQAQPADTPEQRVRAGERAMAVVNEHPNVNVRKIYAGQVATQLGLAVGDLVKIAERGTRRPQMEAPRPSGTARHRDTAEFAVLSALVQSWDEVAPILVGELFLDEVNRRAFDAIAANPGDLHGALAAADPEAREILERAAIVDLEIDPEVEVRHLAATAVRRALRGPVDPARIVADTEARRLIEVLHDPDRGREALDVLLGWLAERDPTGSMDSPSSPQSGGAS